MYTILTQTTFSLPPPVPFPSVLCLSALPLLISMATDSLTSLDSETRIILLCVATGMALSYWLNPSSPNFAMTMVGASLSRQSTGSKCYLALYATTSGHGMIATQMAT